MPPAKLDTTYLLSVFMHTYLYLPRHTFADELTIGNVPSRQLYRVLMRLTEGRIDITPRRLRSRLDEQ